jgi:hypothetical protein
MRAETRDEVAGFAFGKTIEEEVGCNEVVVCAGRLEGAGISADGREAILCADAHHPSFEAPQHSWALVDRAGANLRVGREEFCEEAAVAIADDECLAGISKGGQVVEPAALEHGAEGKIFHRAVEVGYAIEAT